VEYALVQHWRETGAINTAEEEGRGESSLKQPPRAPSSAVQQIIAVSGSCSPVTDRQIVRAVEHGFAEVGAGPELLVPGGHFGRALGTACSLLEQRHSVVIHSSRGPEDERFIAELNNKQQAVLGGALGHMLERLLDNSNLRRAVVCGGDTSMHVARALGIEALEYLGPMAPGSPLCKVHAPGRVADGCEIVFKGGQVGRDNFFLDVLKGGPTTA
jgi:3-oxoisoapionate kinase